MDDLYFMDQALELAKEAADDLEYTRALELLSGVPDTFLETGALRAEAAYQKAKLAFSQGDWRTAAEVLAGAVYACLTCHGDFDTAIITAVNHSGRSAAVGAVTGALLGIYLGEEALPEFYLECLEPTPLLRELADDLEQGCPMDRVGALFDGDWDRKYLGNGV